LLYLSLPRHAPAGFSTRESSLPHTKRCRATALLISFEMENFFERHHRLIGMPAADVLEEGRHLRLPLGVDFLLRHARERLLEVGCFEVADEQAVVTEEERVIVPARAAQRGEHGGPDFL